MTQGIESWGKVYAGPGHQRRVVAHRRNKVRGRTSALSHGVPGPISLGGSFLKPGGLRRREWMSGQWVGRPPPVTLGQRPGLGVGTGNGSPASAAGSAAAGSRSRGSCGSWCLGAGEGGGGTQPTERKQHYRELGGERMTPRVKPPLNTAEKLSLSVVFLLPFS